MGTAGLNDKTEGVINSLATVVVLFTALLDPRVSIGIAAAVLAALAAHKLRPR
jgi:hypothetical protein